MFLGHSPDLDHLVFSANLGLKMKDCCFDTVTGPITSQTHKWDRQTEPGLQGSSLEVAALLKVV